MPPRSTAPKPPVDKPAATPVATSESPSPAASPLVGMELSCDDFKGAPAVALVQAVTDSFVTLKVEVTGEEITVPISQVNFDEGTFRAEVTAVETPAKPDAPPVLSTEPTKATEPAVAPAQPAKPAKPVATPPTPAKEASAPKVPNTWVLAQKKGLGVYGGQFFRFPDGQKEPQAVGVVTGWFPPEIVARFPGEFERVKKV